MESEAEVGIGPTVNLSSDINQRVSDDPEAVGCTTTRQLLVRRRCWCRSCNIRYLGPHDRAPSPWPDQHSLQLWGKLGVFSQTGHENCGIKGYWCLQFSDIWGKKECGEDNFGTFYINSLRSSDVVRY